MPISFMAKEKGDMVGGGRGGCGNIVHKDQVAPPPAPMESSLEVETARDRLTTHGRGGKGNQFWHVIEEGIFEAVIQWEHRMVLCNRAREDDSPKSPRSSSLNGGDHMGSPTSDRATLWHTENACEDEPMASGGSSRLSFGEPIKRLLRSPTKRWNRQSTSSSDHDTRSRSTTATSADLHTIPVTPIDRPVSPVSVASHEDASSPLSGPLDISSPALQYPLSSSPGK